MRKVCFLMITGLFAHTVQAEPSFARMYKQEYGYQPSCNACHKDGGGSPVNSYGEQFKQAEMTRAAFADIAELDADADGSKNVAEAKAKSNPGDAESTPEKPGEWLNIANLIPKPVQQLFAGVTVYKPLDAILTAKEIAKAKTFGVTLTEKDENTIYIPVKDKKAAGTAIIVPAQVDGKQFFVLVATDRSLTISAVQALQTESSGDEIKSLDAYTAAVGKNLQNLKFSTGGSSAELAAQKAIKTALTIINVRLKR